MVISGKFKYLAFYDLDRTILNENSATALVEEARKRGMMSTKQFRHALFLSIIYKLDLGNPTKMINRMLTWLKGIEEASMKQLCLDVFNHLLVDTIRPEILESLNFHRKKEGAVIILSSATSLICEPVSDYLRMDEVICTQLESEHGKLTGFTQGLLVYSKEKQVQMLSFCKKHQYDPADAYYYGDSHTDFHVMAAVGNPVAVAPDKRLLRIARTRKWPVVALDR
jgi:putative phosphoserine phosphatase/1-acylglycerol-3-phosphate O-acyltransferase